MSEDLSPAAQFAAAAAAEAEAEALAAAAAAAVAAVAVAPAVQAGPAEVVDQIAPSLALAGFGKDSAPPATAVAPIGTASAACAPPGSGQGESFGDCAGSSVGNARLTALDDHVSAAAAFESAVDSAVASNAGNDSDNDEIATHAAHRQPAKSKKPIDLADEELFPSLGGPASGRAAPAAWGTQSAAAAPMAGAAAGGPQSMAAQLRLMRATEVLDLPMMQTPIADTVRKIMERTKAHIEVSHNRVLKMTTYLVSGRPEGVAKAKREICAKLSPQVSKVVQVPALVRAQIAGVRGRTLQSIQEQTHTAISLPKPSSTTKAASGNDNSLFEMIDVSVTGDHAGVLAAIAQIEAIVDKSTTKRAVRLPEIPRALHALLSGKDGETLQALRTAHPQVQIYVPGPLDDQPVSVVGERDAVNAAVAEIKETAHALMQSSQTITVTIPKRQHQFIVGPSGQTLVAITHATGCSVSVPPPRSPSDQVTVRGPESALVQALGLVMSKANSTAVDVVDPTAIHAYGRPLLYASRALLYLHDRNRFRRIESEHGVTLRVPSAAAAVAAQSPEQLQIEIQGKDSGAVDAARQALVGLFAAFPPFHFNSIDVEPHLHPLLAGSDGAGVARLQAARSVYALFPKDSAARDILVVYEGFNPDIDRIADAAGRERATRDLLRKTLEEFRATIQQDSTFAAKVVEVPASLQLKLGKPAALAGLLAAAGTSQPSSDNAAQVALRFGALAESADLDSTRVKRKKGEEQLDEGEVEVKGLADDVDRVAAELLRRVAEAAEYERLHSFCDHIVVPQQARARIIGRGGENIKRIRAEHDVSVDVADSTGSAPVLVRLQGTREGVAAVIAEMQELLEHLADQTTETISAPANIHHSLIGTGGKYVRRLEDKYSVRITFPSSRRETGDDAGPLGPDQIRIRGGRKGVDSAKTELLELAAYEAEHSHTVRFKVAAACLPHIVGKAGSRISELMDTSETRIDLSSPKNGEVEVVVVGTRAGTKTAREEIEAIVAGQESQTELVLDVPAKHHRFLIGPAGSRIRELVAQAGGNPDATSGPGACRVRFASAGASADWVKLKGDRAVVDAAKARIEALVAERERMVTIAVAIPASQHAFVIGRGGANLMQLQDQHSVEINIRSKGRRGPSEEDPNSAFVTGLPENCEACKAALLALVRDEATVTVPLAVHLRLGGRKGALWRRLRNELDVQADSTSADKAPARDADGGPSTGGGVAESSGASVVYRDLFSDLAGLKAEWVLRGEKAKLAQAQELISREVENAESSVEARIRVEPRLHRRIIGKQGAAIANIRDTTGCEVTVPKRDSSSEWVLVSGPRASIGLAIELIGKAAEEHE
ncbi:hypothetical protein LPJ61_003311 [Coemansia biformis]|uniref:K Homology domain-containing protein n=1 Tax=Coemansia biformis TaxID=1286918 RepID=A0A9W7YCE4_9FUNG|nr:hypothetical protein LPJ61_003311 [Coemansia biformis]